MFVRAVEKLDLKNIAADVMAEDDSEWIVESIVGYLGSPEWVVPVSDFMENKCTGDSKIALPF